MQALAIVLCAEGRPREALEEGISGLGIQEDFGGPWLADAIADAAEAALALDDLPEVERLIDTDRLQPAKVTPLLLAQSARIGALVAGRRGEVEQAESGFCRAAGLFRDIDAPFWLAVTLLEHAELLGAVGEAAPLLEEARATFERLQAHPWVERADAVGSPLATIAAESD